ncbi:tetratricopeptide repeat protein [Xanthomarina sp. GH4-25]|uniref:tetratricopeptide repeat protein n=1 Tax=Xanthomarina sp. GH4-25 TaxID=3349335 RepID=UPI003877AB31
MIKKAFFLILILLQCLLTFSQVRESIININDSELKLLINKAENGDADAQIELGARYYNGYGVLKDYEKSTYWTKKSAEQGLPDAQYALAIYYGSGSGVPKDIEKAFYWFEKSAMQENKHAQFQLGIMYLLGKGVQPNKKKGATWIKKSMDNGSDRAKEIWNEKKLWVYL